MPKPTIYSYTIQDSMGTKATLAVYVAYDASTETVGALTGNYAALGGVIDAMIDGAIIDGNITINVAPDPSWKAAPVADSIVSRGVLFSFNANGTPYPQEEYVPAFGLSHLDPDGRVQFDTQVTAWINNMTQNTGIGGSNTVFANNKFLLALESLKSVYTSVRKHRRKLKQETFELAP